MGLVKKYSFRLIGYLFFLFNSIGLPAPVLYSNLISVVGIKSLLGKKDWKILITFFSVTLLYAAVHVYTGVVFSEYIKTFVFMQIMVFTTLVAYNYIKRESSKMSRLFGEVTHLSFVLFLVSILLYFTPLKEFMWLDHDFSIEGKIARYKSFTYEPSFFALLMSPIFIYFLLKTIYISFKSNIWKLMMVLIPCIFTLSFGFFGVIVIAIIIFLMVVFLKYKTIHKAFFYSGLLVVLVGGVLLSFDTFLSARVNKIMSGEDTSVNGRITESYYLANKIIKEEEKFFGVGLGQIKIVGEKYIRQYYAYSKEDWPVVSLPNATAETLAIYGYLGLLIRLFIPWLLFFKFKVYTNYFNLFMFLFIFLYQLIGSFVTSSTELILWVFAILPVFKELDIQPSFKFKLI
ncbi:MAG: hypothetical protein ACJAV5_000958 [Vicingaceae bacterium]|jgi:hypothetical protein